MTMVEPEPGETTITEIREGVPPPFGGEKPVFVGR
jgi:hypothetical protein